MPFYSAYRQCLKPVAGTVVAEITLRTAAVTSIVAAQNLIKARYDEQETSVSLQKQIARTQEITLFAAYLGAETVMQGSDTEPVQTLTMLDVLASLGQYTVVALRNDDYLRVPLKVTSCISVESGRALDGAPLRVDEVNGTAVIDTQVVSLLEKVICSNGTLYICGTSLP